MLGIIFILLSLLIYTMITIYVLQEDNRSQQDFIDHQGSVIDGMRPHLAATYWLAYSKEELQ